MLNGCAAALPSQSTAALTSQDQDALSRLAEVAGPTSGVPAATIEYTECWLPSANMLPAASVGRSADDGTLESGASGAESTDSGTSYSVLCRVHYTDPDTRAARYQDTTCIGDLAASEKLQGCYRWTYYDSGPQFSDQDAYRAGAD